MSCMHAIIKDMMSDLLADLERGSLRSSVVEEDDSLAACAAANLGDPTSLEGESHRVGDDATIRFASWSHSCVNLPLLLLVLSSKSTSSSIKRPPVKLYSVLSFLMTVPKNISFMKSVRSGTLFSVLRRFCSTILFFSSVIDANLLSLGVSMLNTLSMAIKVSIEGTMSEAVISNIN